MGNQSTGHTHFQRTLRWQDLSNYPQIYHAAKQKVEEDRKYTKKVSFQQFMAE